MSDEDIIVNAKKFRNGLSETLADNLTTIVNNNSNLLDGAYTRLTTLQAWRSFVLEEKISPAALGFFSEAQNDGLTSSVLVAAGMWRPAMKSLRSLIENTIQCLYFKDHPVEYRLWDEGKYRISFKDLFDYFQKHPEVSKLPENLQVSILLKSHYSHLSNVVHASAREFRMTDEMAKLNLWKTTSEGVGKWSATQKNVLRDVNILMLAIFKDNLSGASNMGLRKSLALVVPKSKDAGIKAALGIKIIR